MQKITLDQRGFATRIAPVGSQGMMRFAVDFETNVNAFLNGLQAADRYLFQAPSELTLSGDNLTGLTLALHTVKAETGTSDSLQGISARNNTFLVLKAKTGHTIAIKNGLSNVYTPGGASISMSGNVMVMLWCDGGQWSVIGVTPPANNFAATTDPDSSDDAAGGYSVNSLWINTTLKRVWACVDSTSGTAIWKWISPRLNRFSARAANTLLQPVGIAAPSVNVGLTPSANNATEGPFVLYTGAAGTSNQPIISTSFDLVRPAHNPVAEFYVRTDSSITSMRFWVGLSSAGALNQDSQATSSIKFIGFRFKQGTDTGWVPVLSDGTTQNVGTAIGTVTTNTVYKLRMRVDNANSKVYFSVNDSAEQMLTTNYPAAATDMGFSISPGAFAAVAPLLNVGTVEVGW